jgi:LysM repeat protein
MKTLKNKTLRLAVLIVLLAPLILSFWQPASARNKAIVAPGDLIVAMNGLRMANGLPALIEDAIINAVAQATAQTMADTLASWHIGNAAGRIQAAGYGGGAKVYATENFAMGGSSLTLEKIVYDYWNDPDHMLPATTPAYCHVGAGAATASNGVTYYVLQAAFTSTTSCGPTSYDGGGTGSVPTVPQYITPVEIAEPNAQGYVIHEVKFGQSLYTIAEAYKVQIVDLRQWNNLSEKYVLQVGDKLVIPLPGTTGYVTPTPRNMVQLATPGPDGSIVHIVRSYQYLDLIAQAYGVPLKTILDLNSMAATDVLVVGQKLVIKGSLMTPTPTTRPLTPIERLTPGPDGKYYHIVAEGQNPTWIAQYYGITLADLIAWNGGNEARVWYPGEKMLLEVTPPPTLTPTLAPPTATPIPSLTPTQTGTPQPTATIDLTPLAQAVLEQERAEGKKTLLIWIGIGAAAIGVAGWYLMHKKKPVANQETPQE